MSASKLCGRVRGAWPKLLSVTLHPKWPSLKRCLSVSDSRRTIQPPLKPPLNIAPQIDENKNNVMTIPNALCIARVAATPVIGCLVVQSNFLPACILFMVAGITDMLDGFIARRYPTQRSLLGSILDPVADKLLVSTLFITLTCVDLIPLYLTLIVFLRDVCLVVGGFIRRYQMLEPPITLKRFFDPSISAVRIEPTLISKVNTALQLSLVTFSLASPVFDFVGHTSLNALGIITCTTTIYSGLQYIGGNAMKRI